MVAPKPWNALEHSPLMRLSDNLWQCDGMLPKMSLRRRMCVSRLDSGGLVIHNAIAMDEEGMAALSALGEIAIVLVPNAYHRLDAGKFKQRFPNAKILCPAGARTKVEKVVAVDGSYDDFPKDSKLELRHLNGLKEAEGVLRVEEDAGTTLVFNDCLFNIEKGGKGDGFIMGLLGSTGGPKVTRIMRWFVVKDKKALAEDLAALAKTPNLVRLVPGHGEIVETHASAVLKSVSEAL